MGRCRIIRLTCWGLVAGLVLTCRGGVLCGWAEPSNTNDPIKGVVKLNMDNEPDPTLPLDISTTGETSGLNHPNLNLNAPTVRLGTRNQITTLSLGGTWPQNPNTAMQRLWDDGLDAVATQDMATARQLLTQLVDQLQSPLQAYHYGEGLATLGYVSLAQQAFDKALAWQPSLSEAIAAQQAIYIPQAPLSPDDEDTWVRALLQGHPLPIELAELDPGQAGRAMADLNTLLQTNPSFTPAYYGLGLVALQATGLGAGQVGV
jgi:tetratricopeptide (TPR) repeat protein